MPVHAEGGSFKAVRYEGYGPGGAAIVVDSVTDDRGRTGAEVRKTFTEYGGNLGAQGSVSYLFHTVGLMTFPPGTDETRLMQVALEAGAEDVVQGADTSIEVLADPVEFETVRAILTDGGFVPTTAAVTERASIPTSLSGSAAELTVQLLEALEDWTTYGTFIRMSRYRTKSWRAFDEVAHAAARADAASVPAPVGVVARGVAPSGGGRGRGTSVSTVRPAVTVRILGVDPGSRKTGFGIIECRGGDYVHVAHGCLNVGGAIMAERLRLIFDGLQALIGEHQPAEVAVERVFVNRNVESALKLGQARGAALCAVPRGLPVFEYAPRAIKLAVVGSGAAEKAQVAHMITALLRLSGRIGPDASDALAVAVCHAHSRRLHALAQVNE